VNSLCKRNPLGKSAFFMRAALDTILMKKGLFPIPFSLNFETRVDTENLPTAPSPPVCQQEDKDRLQREGRPGARPEFANSVLMPS